MNYPAVPTSPDEVSTAPTYPFRPLSRERGETEAKRGGVSLAEASFEELNPCDKAILKLKFLMFSY